MSAGNPIERRRYSIATDYVAMPSFTSDVFDSRTIGDQIVLSNDEQTSLVLRVTSDQMSDLFAAAFYGALLLYPINRTEVIAPLWGAMYMSLCDEIAQCLKSDSGVQSALNDALSQLNYPSRGNDTSLPATYNENPLLFDDADVGCDDASLFGVATGLVDLLNTIIEDVLEIVIASTNVAQQTGNLIEAIPLFSLLPFDDILQIAADFLEDVQQNYQASYTQALRDEMRCDIYCIMKAAGCELSLTDVADYYAQKAKASIFQVDLADAIEFFTAGTFSGVEYVYVVHYMVLLIHSYGGSIFGYDTTYVSRVISTLFNDPDSDYAILCTDCPPANYCLEFDFTQSDAGFSILESRGEFTANGINGTAGTGSTAIRVNAQRTFNDGFNVTDVELVYTCNSRSTSDSVVYVRINENDALRVDVPADGTDVDISETGLNLNGDTITIYFDTGLSTGDVLIKSLTIRGNAQSPTGASNCV